MAYSNQVGFIPICEAGFLHLPCGSAARPSIFVLVVPGLQSVTIAWKSSFSLVLYKLGLTRTKSFSPVEATDSETPSIFVWLNKNLNVKLFAANLKCVHEVRVNTEVYSVWKCSCSCIKSPGVHHRCARVRAIVDFHIRDSIQCREEMNCHLNIEDSQEIQMFSVETHVKLLNELLSQSKARLWEKHCCRITYSSSWACRNAVFISRVQSLTKWSRWNICHEIVLCECDNCFPNISWT